MIQMVSDRFLSFSFALVAISCVILPIAAFVPPHNPSVATHRCSSNSASSNTRTVLFEAPVPFAGVGPRSEWMDMSKYDVDDLSLIEAQWRANIIAKTIDTPERIALGCNGPSFFVDTLLVPIRRKAGEGLGIELQEIAGGREDGLGITVIMGLVEGGCAERCAGDVIRAGDSIGSITVKQTLQSTGNMSEEETYVAVTECLGYDATVDAILGLPQPSEKGGESEVEQELMLSIKRVREKPRVKVNLRYPPSQNEPDSTIDLYAGENLRLAMLVRGVKLNDPLAKRFDTKSGGNCGAGGLCRTCAVSVLRGGEVLNPQKISEKQMLEDNPRWRLACKAFVGYGMQEGEITLQVNPRQWGQDSEEWS
mmetsp:Transcript_16198/g.46540  ORF Transcript_16198/g.46540 Transcript_16198/m.46540 type:complete len:366 (-) Transcript_16198:162-1259(-)